MNTGSRRDFLKASAALAAGVAVMKSSTVMAVADASLPTPGSTRLTQFGYADVQLLDGPMLEQFRHNVELFSTLPDDNLLKPFRQLAGQPAPGEDMGGWYSPSKDFDPPKNMTGYIPGHSFGQYLSGLSRAYAATGDKAIQTKVHSLVSGLAPTIDTKFYDGYCIPAYTFDKTNCGLIDAHQFAGDTNALAVLDEATDAVLPWLPEKALDHDEMMARPHKNISYTWDETYTLPENFYLGYQRGAGARYRQLAQRFLQDDTYFGPLSEGRNVLPGQHAYSHVNALCSAMQCYLTDNSSRHLDAARNGFKFVLEQSFATGGWGPNEGFCEPGTDQLAKSLHSTHSSFETPCGAYGHFKISRYLMRVIGDSAYGDSMEAMLYNTILGARPIRSDGISFYYADYNMNGKKVDYEQKWPCCSGTFPQLTADYGISSYLRSSNGVYVNLFVPSRVTWKQGNARVTMTQETNYPPRWRDGAALADGPSRAFRDCVTGAGMGREPMRSSCKWQPSWDGPRGHLVAGRTRMEKWGPGGIHHRYAAQALSAGCRASEPGRALVWAGGLVRYRTGAEANDTKANATGSKGLGWVSRLGSND